MASPASSNTQRTIRSICIFFPMGQCGKGDECKFSHDVQSGAKQPPASSEFRRKQLVNRTRRGRRSSVETQAKEHVNLPVVSREASPSDDHPNDLTAAALMPDTNVRQSTSAIQQLNCTDDGDQGDNSEDRSHSGKCTPVHDDNICLITQPNDAAHVDTEPDQSPLSESSKDESPISEVLVQPEANIHQSDFDAELHRPPIVASSVNDILVAQALDESESDIHQKDVLDHLSFAEWSENDNLVSGTIAEPETNSHGKDEYDHPIVPEPSEEDPPVSEGSESIHTPEFGMSLAAGEQNSSIDVHGVLETGEMQTQAEMDASTYIYNPESDMTEDISLSELSPTQYFNTYDAPSYAPDGYNWEPSHTYPDVLTAEMGVPHWSEHADPYANFMVPFCRFLAQGRCTQGDSCRFRHSLSINEFSLLFHDAQPPLWDFGTTTTQTDDANKALVSPFNVCKFYPMGNCRNGQTCPYLHIPSTDLLSIVPEELPESYENDRATRPTERKNQPCKYYLEPGGCSRGDKCHFIHNASTPAQTPGDGWEDSLRTDDGGQQGKREDSQPRKRSICKWFQQGNCKWGDGCKFLHDSPTEEARYAERIRPTPSEEAEPAICTNDTLSWETQNFRWSDDDDEWTRQAIPDASNKDDLQTSGEPQSTAAFAEKDAQVSEEELPSLGWGINVDEWAVQGTAASAEKDAQVSEEETPNFGWGENIDEWAAQETPAAAEKEIPNLGRGDNVDELAGQETPIGGPRKLADAMVWGESVDEWAIQETSTAVPESSVRVSEGTSNFEWGQRVDEWATKEASNYARHGGDRATKEATIKPPKENGWSTRSDSPRINGRDICRFYAQGYCKKGAQCNRSHELPKELLQTGHQDRHFPATPLPTTLPTEHYPKLPSPLSIGPAQEQTLKPVSGDGQWSDDMPDNDHTGPIQPICNFFARGHCKYGDRCTLRHEKAPGRTNNSMDASVDVEIEIETPPAPSKEQEVEEAIAKDEPPLVTGECDIDHQQTSSEQEAFPQSSHDDEKTWEVKWPEEPAELLMPAKIEAPCKAFGQGYCELGDACPYQHLSDPLESQGQNLTPSAPDNDEITEDMGQGHGHELGQEEPELLVERELFNCTVRFGLDNGCSPTSIRSASDAFQAIVSNLPTDMSLTEAVELADIVDIGQGDEDVVLEGTDVVMKFAEPLSAAKAVTKLHGQTYASRLLTARLTTETIVSPLECNAVKITWPSPSRSAWAYYPTAHAAKMNEKRLTGTIFQGRKIKAELYRARKNDASYAVRISGLLAKVDRPALEELAQALVVHLNAATYMECPLDNIRATLTRAAQGSIESFHRLPLNPTQSKHIAFARFYAGLSDVMTEHAKPCNFLGEGESLSLQEVFYANYKVSARRYQPVSAVIEQLREAHKENCQIRIYDDEEPIDIHIYADRDNCATFGEANREVRETLQGEIFTQEGKSTPVWDEYFDLSSSARAIDKINNDKSFFVKVDHRRQVVYILGDETSRERGKTTLCKLLGMVQAQRHVLPLDQHTLRYLVDGGFESLQEELGANKVTLDVAVPHLVVRGDVDLKKAKSALSAPTAPAENHNASGSELGSHCPVCRRPPREPVKLSCRHAYCTACLRYTLSSPITPLRCLVGCEEYIPYVVVRDVLPMASEAALLRNAFLFHVRARPDQFFFCPLPHCETVFRLLSLDRRGALTMVYVCPGCSTKVCATCRSEYHEGWDCNA